MSRSIAVDTSPETLYTHAILPPVTPPVLSATSKPTHLPWKQLPEVTQTRLSAQYDSLVSRCGFSKHGFLSDGWIGYTQALGLSTSEADGVPTDGLLYKYRDICDILEESNGNLYELYHHRE